MYIRTVVTRSRQGAVRYLQVAHNYRDPRTGMPRAKVLLNLGRADQVDRAALERFVGSLRRFLDADAEQGVRAAVAQAGLQFVAARAFGGCWLLDQVWRRLELDQALHEVLGRAAEPRLERAILAMVANRALAPRSKLSVTEWVSEEAAIPEWPTAPLPEDPTEREAERKRRANLFYHAMDVLAAAAEEVQHQVFRAISGGSFLDLDVDLLYFDSTSTYWETEEEDEAGDEPEGRPVRLRRRGHSKDRRADLPQVVIGLAVTRAGIPVRCWVWPGNTADVSVIEEVKRDLSGWRLGRVITVVDRGFVSEANLRTLQRQGGHYIAGEKMRAGMAEADAALARAGRYRPVRPNVEVKEVVIGDGEARHRYVVVRNPVEVERDRLRREQVLADLRRELEDLRQAPGEEHSKRACALRTHPVFGRYLTTDGQGRLKIDAARAKAEERVDGKYLLRTSDDTLRAEDVALGYRQLLEVEAAFRTLKTTLELRPVYHWVEGRVRAHVLLCWLALLLVRVVEEKTGRSWRSVRQQWEQMRLIEFRGPDGQAAQRTAMTTAQRQTLSALGLDEPPLMLELVPRPTRGT